MQTEPDPATLAPRERLHEVAAILAAGLLRLRDRAALDAGPTNQPASNNIPESGEDCLEVPAKTVLSVHGG